MLAAYQTVSTRASNLLLIVCHLFAIFR